MKNATELAVEYFSDRVGDEDDAFDLAEVIAGALREQREAVLGELGSLIAFRKKRGLPYAETVGVLGVVRHALDGTETVIDGPFMLTRKKGGAK